jgi:hypothetical protein
MRCIGGVLFYVGWILTSPEKLDRIGAPTSTFKNLGAPRETNGAERPPSSGRRFAPRSIRR